MFPFVGLSVGLEEIDKVVASIDPILIRSDPIRSDPAD